MIESKKVSGPPPAASSLAAPLPPTRGELAPAHPESVLPTADTERPAEAPAAKPDLAQRTGEMKPVEDWAVAKGHIVLRNDGSRDVTAPELWRFRAAQAGQNWPQGIELTEAEYDGAIAEAEKVEVR